MLVLGFSSFSEVCLLVLLVFLAAKKKKKLHYKFLSHLSVIEFILLRQCDFVLDGKTIIESLTVYLFIFCFLKLRFLGLDFLLITLTIFFLFLLQLTSSSDVNVFHQTGN